MLYIEKYRILQRLSLFKTQKTLRQQELLIFKNLQKAQKAF